MMQLSQCTWTFPELLKRPAFLRRSIDSISSRSRSSSKYPSFMASASTVSAPNTEAEQTHNPPQPLQVIHLWLLPFLKMFWWVCFNFRSCLAISCKSMGFFFLFSTWSVQHPLLKFFQENGLEEQTSGKVQNQGFGTKRIN